MTDSTERTTSVADSSHDYGVPGRHRAYLSRHDEDESIAAPRVDGAPKHSATNPDAYPTFVDLDDTDLILARPEDDIRGRLVVARDGDEVGAVDGLLIDEAERRVRFLQVGSGGFLGLGKKSRLIPVDAVTLIDEAVHVDTTRSQVSGSPDYDPQVIEVFSPEDYYGHYGLSPYWGPPSLLRHTD